MNTISVWKDRLVLRWDKQLPPNVPEDAIHTRDDVRHFWPHLKEYCRYNEKMHAFLMSFSVQNLKRVREQFNDNVSVADRRSQDRIDRLKLANRAFINGRAQAVEIKGAPSTALPSLESLGVSKYKPLGVFHHRGIIFLLRNRMAPLFMDCGTGKTGLALVSTEILMKQGIIAPGKTLITGKLATLETGWLADALKFTDLKVSLLWEKPSMYRRENIMTKIDEPADVYLINHEGLREFEGILCTKKFQRVIVDESTILKGFHGMHEGLKGGKLGQSLMRIAEHAEWRVVMSGTPAPNGAEDLWGQFCFLDPNGCVLEPSYHDFQKTYMKEVHFGKPLDDGSYHPKTPKKWVTPKESAEKISNLIAPLAYRVRIRDHLHELPPLTKVMRDIDMTDDQLRHYQTMKESLRVIIDDKTISVNMKLSQLMKLRQITGGFIIDAQEEAHPIPNSPKLELLDQLVEEEIAHDEKVIIYAQYKWEIETIQNRYKHHGAISGYGGNASATNLDNIKKFINDPKHRIIVLHPKSMAHGITLTCAHYMIFYSYSHSFEEDYQSVKRIERAGQKEVMFVYYLRCKDSIDFPIYDVLVKKGRAQDQLIDQRDADLAMLEEWDEHERHAEGEAVPRALPG